MSSSQMCYAPSVLQNVYELCFVSSTGSSSLRKGSFEASRGERSGSSELIAREEAQLGVGCGGKGCCLTGLGGRVGEGSGFGEISKAINVKIT